MKLWIKTAAQDRPPEASRLGHGTHVSVREQSVTSSVGGGLQRPEQSLCKVPAASTSIAPDKAQPGLERGA